MLSHVASLLLILAAASASGLPVEYGDALLQSAKEVQLSAQQGEHHVMQKLMNARKPSNELYLNLQQMTTDLAARNENCSHELLTVIDIVLNQTRLVMDDEKDAKQEGQSEIDQVYDDGVAKCDGDLGVSDDFVKGLRVEHSECRSNLKELNETTNVTCEDFIKLHVTIEGYPPCMYAHKQPYLHGRATVTSDCMNDISQWLLDYRTEFEEAESICSNNTNVLDANNELCTGKQEKFESSYCQWEALAEANYNEYAKCYSDLGGSYTEKVDKVRGNIATSEAEYVAADKTRCLLEMIKANPSNLSAVIHQMPACNEVDTTMFKGLNNRSVPITPPVTLGEKVPAKKPCNADWIDVEYENKPWYRDEIKAACTSCESPDEAVDESACIAHCRNRDYCCNDPAIGSNQFLSCSQACKVRASGTSRADCSAACDLPRSCEREVGGLKFGMCSSCNDLTDKCPHGVQSVDACHEGCDFTAM